MRIAVDDARRARTSRRRGASGPLRRSASRSASIVARQRGEHRIGSSSSKVIPLAKPGVGDLVLRRPRRPGASKTARAIGLVEVGAAARVETQRCTTRRSSTKASATGPSRVEVGGRLRRRPQGEPDRRSPSANTSPTLRSATRGQPDVVRGEELDREPDPAGQVVPVEELDGPLGQTPWLLVATASSRMGPSLSAGRELDSAPGVRSDFDPAGLVGDRVLERHAHGGVHRVVHLPEADHERDLDHLFGREVLGQAARASRR